MREFARQGVARGYPGMALMASDASGRIRQGAAGTSDAEHGIVLRSDNAFHIGSITKSLTAVATLRLVDQHKLRLDATLQSVLGKTVEHIPYADVITVAQLLDHSSNIYPTNNDSAYLATMLGSKADPHKIWSPEEMLALADGRQVKPSGKPGDGYTYSDTNYILLGMIIAKISGRPFKRFVKEEIFIPLGMSSTYFYSDAVTGAIKAPEKMVQGYIINTKDLREFITINSMFKSVPQLKSDLGPVLNTTLASERIDSAAGVISNLPDLLKFGDAMFRGKLLTRESQATLTGALVGMDRIAIDKKRTRTLQSVRKSYGVVLFKEGDGPGGTTAILAYLPAQDRILAGFTNSLGYFDEVDFMLDKVMAEIAANPVTTSSN